MIKKYKDDIISILFGILIAFIATRFFAFTLVYGDSMLPTYKHGDYLFVNKIAYKFSEPKRGDVIVFKSNLPTQKYLIKRIIGVPGDVIEIKNNKLYINGKETDEKYIKEPMSTDDIKVIVGKDKYFVMGDNRNHSLDSRYTEVGQIAKTNILGKVEFKIFNIKLLLCILFITINLH